MRNFFKLFREDKQCLPRWAAVAFAARCGRHIWPVFESVWPDAPAEHSEALLASIDVAESCAAEGRAIEQVGQANELATRICGRLNLYSRGLLEDEDVSFPTVPAMTEIAMHSAAVASKATEAVQIASHRAHDIAMDGWSWAIVVAGERQDLVDAMQNEYWALEDAVLLQRWNHKTPVEWKDGRWISGASQGKPMWKLW